MTNDFSGFPGHDRPIIIPETFFSDLLPHIQDVAELKLTLFCMWALQQREGRYQFLTVEDFTRDETFMGALQAAAPDAAPLDTLHTALQHAVQRGTLLQAEISRSDEGAMTVYLMNSERGRMAYEAIQQGRVNVGEQVEILPPRPNIYRLYEQEIGALTPLIADDLKDLQHTYSERWLHDAIQVAVREQKRHIRYITAVLQRWRKEGKYEITGRQSTRDDADGQQYITGKYADFIDH